MGKTVADIITDMDNEQANQPALSGITTTSSTAVFKKKKHVVAVAGKYLYDAFTAVKEELKTLASSYRIGTCAWYVTLAKDYNGGLLVAKASCIENGPKVILKVAKEVGGVTDQLTIAELTNLKTYIRVKKVAGTDIDVISQTADLVDIELDIQYNGVQATVEAAVIQAIKDYLDDLEFDSDLSKTLLVDELLNLPDVVNAYVKNLKVDIGAGYTLISGNLATPDAGYWEIGKDTSNNDLITLNMYT